MVLPVQTHLPFVNLNHRHDFQAKNQKKIDDFISRKVQKVGFDQFGLKMSSGCSKKKKFFRKILTVTVILLLKTTFRQKM